MSDGQADFAERTDPALPQPGLYRTDLRRRHHFVEEGELKVRTPNPHKGGNVDWSLVKEILRQAGIKASDCDKA